MAALAANPLPCLAAEQAETTRAVSAVQPAQPLAPGETEYWQALKLAQTAKRQDFVRVQELLKTASAAGNTHAQVFTALAMLNGELGYKKAPRAAGKILLAAAEKGNAYAQVNVGLCYMSGNGFWRSAKKSRKWLQAAVAPGANFTAPNPPEWFHSQTAPASAQKAATVSGDIPISPQDRALAVAHLALGDLWQKEDNLPAAHSEYVKAATQGEGGRAGLHEAALKAAIGYAFGKGVPQDRVKADEMLGIARKQLNRNGVAYIHSAGSTRQFDSFAQGDAEDELAKVGERMQKELQVAIASSFGDRTSKQYDPAEAAKWYQLAADEGEGWAMLSLALLYCDPSFGKEDGPKKAFEWFVRASEKEGQSLAWGNLAICHARGYGTEQNNEKALEIAREHSDFDIVSHLVVSGNCPQGPVSREQALIHLEAMAKQRNDTHSLFILGLHQINGWGVKENLQAGIKLMQKAAEAGDPVAMRQLGIYHEISGALFGIWIQSDALAKARYYYEKAAAKGDTMAMLKLGERLEVGRGETQDPAAGLVYYLKAAAAKPKDAEVQVHIGNANKALATKAAGDSEERKAYTAAMHSAFAKAEELKSKTVHYHQAEVFREGLLCAKDAQQAFSLYDKSVTAGGMEGRSHFRMGVMLEEGDGMPASIMEAAYHYRRAATHGDKDGLRALCRLYTTNSGLPRNWDRAAYWLGQLAREGDHDAAISLVDALLQKGEEKVAFNICKELSGVAHPTARGAAAERLSRMYEKGLGVKANAKQAEAWFNKALNAGDRTAQYRNALKLMDSGNADLAMSLLRNSAEKGNPDALYLLGNYTLEGTRATKNEAGGWDYMRRAAKQGSLDAMVFLINATLEAKPEAPDLAEAQRYAEVIDASEDPRAAELLQRLELAGNKPNGEAPGNAGHQAAPATQDASVSARG